MCGIVGIAGDGSDKRQRVRLMAESLQHRGPDDFGDWISEDEEVAFGFTRLAILDLSPDGHQPMVSSSGRYVIVFNGEIYNFKELRKELEQAGAHFRGTGDTEVLLAGIEERGLVPLLPQLNGMFALAVWDRQEKQLSLARDRVGKKPLYYGWQRVPGEGHAFIFFSEMKALRAGKFERPPISIDGLSSYFERGYLPAPLSIYEGIHKLIPGSYLVLRQEDLSRRPLNFSSYPQTPDGPRQYWSMKGVLARTERFTGTEIDALNECERILKDAVELRMSSDVPLGAFLSGGVDSSLIVAIMQNLGRNKVKTFCIGFREKEYDESRHAKSVAEHLGSEHSELILTPAESMSFIERLPEIFDEPLSNASQIPMFFLSQMARHSVSVALSGDGGDEVFLGYNRYVLLEKLEKLLRLPLVRPLLSSLESSRLLRTLAGASVSGISRILPFSFLPSRPKEALFKLTRIARCESIDERYDVLTRYFPAAIVRGKRRLHGAFLKSEHLAFESDFMRRVSALDIVSYLSEDLLAKVDRATMAVSLEARSPLLDYRLIEFAFSLPPAMRSPRGDRKSLLRKLLLRYLPASLVYRPKVGFSLPIGPWLRGELKSWAEERLRDLEISCGDMIDMNAIYRLWDEHQQNRAERGNELWSAVLFSQWWRANR